MWEKQEELCLKKISKKIRSLNNRVNNVELFLNGKDFSKPEYNYYTKIFTVLKEISSDSIKKKILEKLQQTNSDNIHIYQNLLDNSKTHIKEKSDKPQLNNDHEEKISTQSNSSEISEKSFILNNNLRDVILGNIDDLKKYNNSHRLFFDNILKDEEIIEQINIDNFKL